MRFSVATISLALAALAAAQSDSNPFNVPKEGISAAAGKKTDLTWEPTTSGTVSLNLRKGNSNDLDDVTTIAANIPNDGSYSWTPPSSLDAGSGYAVEIVDDSDPSNTNFTPQFAVANSNPSRPSSASASSASSSASRSRSSASSSASASRTSASRSSASASASASASESAEASASASETAEASATETDSSPTTEVPNSASPTNAAVPMKVSGGGVMAAVLALGAAVIAL
ncbi:MAG: hypothetical protein M1825_002361 [Sarcosagium campestre]|nr:MAG: hypothetical protein M1825_002361 [Sarcosagium campestre]